MYLHYYWWWLWQADFKWTKILVCHFLHNFIFRDDWLKNQLIWAITPISKPALSTLTQKPQCQHSANCALCCVQYSNSNQVTTYVFSQIDKHWKSTAAMKTLSTVFPHVRCWRGRPRTCSGTAGTSRGRSHIWKIWNGKY